MEKEPRKAIIRLLEFCALFALSVFLLRLGVAFLREIWWILLLIAIAAGGSVIGYRVWKSRARW